METPTTDAGVRTCHWCQQGCCVTHTPEANERARLRTEVATLTAQLAAASADADRWRFYCLPQTALILGSKCDPNDMGIDWVAECNRLVDAARTGRK